MNRLITYFNAFINSPPGRIIALILLVVIGAVLVFTGMSFVAAFLAIVVIPLIIFLGYLREAIGSFIMVALIKSLYSNIIGLISVWTEHEAVLNTFAFIKEANFIQGFLVIFFFVFTVKFLTGSVSIFNISSSSTSGQKS